MFHLAEVNTGFEQAYIITPNFISGSLKAKICPKYVQSNI